MTGIRGTTMLENLRANLDSAIERANKLDRECDLMSKSIAHLSGKLAVRRDISHERLKVITKQTRTICAQDKKIDEIKEKSDKRAEVIRDYHRKFCAQDVRIDVLDQSNVSLREAHDRAVKQRNIGRNQLASDGAEINDMRKRITKLLLEVKGAHSNADMWLGQVHQRDEIINSKNILIKQRDAQIKQGDEEMRLLMADIHPDGRTRGHISMMDKVEHVAGEANRFTQSKIAGLQHKNQEIGSQLGYYKMKTGDLRAALNTSESVIKEKRSNLAAAHTEISRLLKYAEKWKRKYHGLLKYHSPRFTPRANGSATAERPYRRIDLADPTIGNTDD